MGAKTEASSALRPKIRIKARPATVSGLRSNAGLARGGDTEPGESCGVAFKLSAMADTRVEPVVA